MGVGGVGGGGGRRGGPKGVGGKPASGSGFDKRVSGADAAGKAESLVGASGAAGSAEAGGVGGPTGPGGPKGPDPITAGAAQIAKALSEGKIASKQEATQQLVQLILKDRGLLGKNGKGSKKLVDRIADTLNDDPRLSAALERTWGRAGKQK